MKKIVLLLAAFPYFVNAQSTLIPDENFEQALIDLSLDDIIDGEVLTENIASIEELNIASNGISDLTGIEDFMSLESLDVDYNDLTELDMSSNAELVYLNCDANSLVSLNVTENSNLERIRASQNNLTSLDLSGNLALVDLSVFENALTSLDLSNNTELLYIYCQTNNIENIDISNLSNLRDLICFQNELTELNLYENIMLESVFCFENNIVMLDLTANPNIESLFCESNNLEFINLSNGNNTLIEFGNFSALDNSNLYCIQVDNETYSTDTWSDGIDDHSTFNNFCGVGINEDRHVEINVYPNPVQELLTVETLESATYTISNVLGNVVQSGDFTEGKNRIDVANFQRGIYFLTIKTNDNFNQSIEQICIK